MLTALEKLVRVESPTEDLAACRDVMDCASQIAHELLGSPAQIQEINGRPVFWWGSQTPEVLSNISCFMRSRYAMHSNV